MCCFLLLIFHKDNVNPIEKLERSALIVSEVIHGANRSEMIV
jgi:hypothetical protein